MNVGKQVRVHLLKQVSDRRAIVREVDTGMVGVLHIKGVLRTRNNGTISAWVMDYDRPTNTCTFGNAFFGKFNISKSISDRYILIIRKLFDSPNELVSDEISFLKGMCNRCLKRDQWDWFTTLQYLGHPHTSVLEEFVRDSVLQRDLIRQNQFNELALFRAKYEFLLQSILFHLSENNDGDEYNLDVPIPFLDSSLWSRLSFESQKNIKVAERLHGKLSMYLLMHYFVTLEQEFTDHFITPFVKHVNKTVLQRGCTYQSYQRTHDILMGHEPCTLGSIRFLGNSISNRQACEASGAIQCFSDFMRPNAPLFSALCADIAKVEVSGVALPKLRNALAHGNAAVLGGLDGAAFGHLRAIMLEPPHQLIRRVLTVSMKS